MIESESAPRSSRNITGKRILLIGYLYGRGGIQSHTHWLATGLSELLARNSLKALVDAGWIRREAPESSDQPSRTFLTIPPGPPPQ